MLNFFSMNCMHACISCISGHPYHFELLSCADSQQWSKTLTWPGSWPYWWFPSSSCLTSLVCCPSTFVYGISEYVPGPYTDSTNHASTTTAVPAHAHAQRMHKHQQPFRIFSKLRQMVFYDSRDGWRQYGAVSAFFFCESGWELHEGTSS